MESEYLSLSLSLFFTQILTFTDPLKDVAFFVFDVWRWPSSGTELQRPLAAGVNRDGFGSEWFSYG